MLKFAMRRWTHAMAVAGILAIAPARYSQEAPAGQIAAPQAPAAALGGIDALLPRLEAGAQLPAVMQPGMRLTWLAASASIPGVRSHLVQDDQGNWVDPGSGQRYSEQETRGTAGAGYVQVTVAHAAPDLILADGRTYLITDVQKNECMSTLGTAYVGTGASLTEFWVHPARLAALKPGKAAGVSIFVGPYPLNGVKYNAVIVRTDTASGYVGYTYDLDTGLLLVYSASSAGVGVQVVGPDGKVTGGAGTASIASTRFISARPLHIPWANEAAPQWATKGRQLAYQGTQTTVIPNAPVPSMSAQINTTITSAGPNWVTNHIASRVAYPNFPPIEGAQDRVAGSQVLPGMWIGTRALADLKPNTVIDQDPVTRFQTTFAGVQNNRAMVVEENPLERDEYYYNTQTGMLTGLRIAQQQGIGQTQTQVQLAE